MASAEAIDRLRRALGSEYDVRREIGRGGMATVFLAQDVKHSRPVALKVLDAPLAESLGPERFRREITIAAQLQHPHILTVLDSGETADGLLWFTMPYIDGESLRARLERERQLSLEDAVRITREVAHALDYAHRAGVVHRDVKPENILLTRDGQALVADFGIARALTTAVPDRTLTATGMALGTPTYMSPEQASGDRAVDARSDVYALGAVAYEMLAGEPPFTGPTAQAILARVLSGDAPSLRRIRPTVPADMDAAIRKALSPVPADRFATALQFTQVLDAAARTHATAPQAAGSATSRAPRTATMEKPRWIRPGLALLAFGVVVSIVGLFAWRSRRASPGAAITTLAVLPFTNGGGDARADYLSDGITESLITSLIHVPQLRVKSRNSVFHYRGKDVDVAEAGKALGVPAVVMGRIVPHGDSIDVSADLVQVRDNTELWGQRYSAKSVDIISLEERIAGDLAAALRGHLSDSATREVTREGTGDPKAYELYLRGRYAWNKRTPGDIQESIGYFGQAIARDSGYALAYAALADAYAVLPQYRDTSSLDVPRAEAAARRALELDPTLAQPHAVLGYVAMLYRWQFAGGEAELRRAIVLDPGDATAHMWYAENLAYIGGREREALAEAQRARELDPLSPVMSTEVGDVLLRSGRYDEAIATCRTVLADDPTFLLAHVLLQAAYGAKGMYAEAIGEYRTLDSLSPPGSPETGAELAHAFAVGGVRGLLKKRLALEQAEVRGGHGPENPYGVAAAAADLGERDLAFEWLDSAYARHNWQLIGLETDPELDSLHSDVRFAALARKIGLPHVGAGPRASASPD